MINPGPYSSAVDAYRARLMAARLAADDQASILNHRGDRPVMAADFAGQGNAYSKALYWLDEMVGVEQANEGEPRQGVLL